MKLKEPAVLLFLWFVLPVGVGDLRLLVAQVLLSQIKAIHRVQQAEKHLDLDLDNDGDEAVKALLSALWFDPGNASAYAGYELLELEPGLLDRQDTDRTAASDSDFTLSLEEIRRKIASNDFEISKSVVNGSALHRIQVHEVKEAIANGQLIEDYPDDRYGPSCLICGLTKAGRAIHVQCSYPSRWLINIINMYDPLPERWNDDFTSRRIDSDDA